MGTLNQVLASLKNHAPRSVLVTGPQRSGTTIVASKGDSGDEPARFIRRLSFSPT